MNIYELKYDTMPEEERSENLYNAIRGLPHEPISILELWWQRFWVFVVLLMIIILVYMVIIAIGCNFCDDPLEYRW